jgi:hypothetical protein
MLMQMWPQLDPEYTGANINAALNMLYMKADEHA